jgi:hypothetical protein
MYLLCREDGRKEKKEERKKALGSALVSSSHAETAASAILKDPARKSARTERLSPGSISMQCPKCRALEKQVMLSGLNPEPHDIDRHWISRERLKSESSLAGTCVLRNCTGPSSKEVVIQLFNGTRVKATIRQAECPDTSDVEPQIRPPLIIMTSCWEP